MYFSGDIAVPFSYMRLPDSFSPGGVWFGNLEGSLIGNGAHAEGVYNNAEAIRELCSHIPYKAFGIANNHLLDAADINTTLTNTLRIGIKTVGASNNLEEANRSIVVTEDNISYRIVAFGWENIQCIPAKRSQQGVNPYTRANVFTCVKEALREKEPVICFMHWNYELEKYPQPYDRKLAMELIDMGVEAVIGCHAHRVQPIEFYKGKPIVYGLGNFLFFQGHYYAGTLRFPKFCEEEYVFEISQSGYKLHYFHYDLQKNQLKFMKSAEISENKEFEGKAEFSGFSSKEYEEWFKIHRVQKKLLPIFYATESTLSYWCKSTWIEFRGGLINILTKMNLKSANRANK